VAETPHPEVTGHLDQQRRCIIVTVASESRTATFRMTEEPETLWTGSSPCPDWGLEAVREWTRTPAAIGLCRQLAKLRGKPLQDDIVTASDRPQKA